MIIASLGVELQNYPCKLFPTDGHGKSFVSQIIDCPIVRDALAREFVVTVNAVEFINHFPEGIVENEFVPSIGILPVWKQWLAMTLELSKMIDKVYLVIEMFWQETHDMEYTQKPLAP